MLHLDDKHKRKALIEATMVMLLLIFLMFISGMKYLDPPPETGIAVNFGTSDVGSGKIQPQQNKPPKPVKTQPKKEETVVQPNIKEEVLTQEIEDAPVIKKIKKKKKVKPKTKPKKIKPAKPKPSSEATNALSSVINAPGNNTNNSGGEGNDTQAGDKGNPDGDPNASGYYGNGGKGGSGNGNYQLGNRNALSKPQPNYQCNEEGTVIVRIYVNRSGRVTKAIPGYKGSTNLAPCLLNAAKKAALNTKWQPDTKAPEKQIGKIIYRFKLTE